MMIRRNWSLERDRERERERERGGGERGTWLSE